MTAKTLLQEEKIERTIKKIRKKSFTVLDFIEVFRKVFPTEWKRLKGKYGRFGEKRRYTVTTYLANRLDLYSQKKHSLLFPLTRYSENKTKDYRKVTRQEKKFFGSPKIAVFRKKLKND